MNALAQISRRRRQLFKMLASNKPTDIGTQARRLLGEWIAPSSTRWPVRPSDVLAAEVGAPVIRRSRLPSPGAPMTLNWVMSPPGPGSGGHTTIFRIINDLARRGFLSRVYFYDPHGGDHQYYSDLTRAHYGFDGPIASLDNGMADADGVLATSWPTAYAVFNAACAGKRFYFVQDYEPLFYPSGALSVLAENTYRMDFHAITAGSWLADKLKAEFAMQADSFAFGCDTARYKLLPNVQRTGIVYYARRGAARRGFELGMMALQIFSERQPNITIHLYGEPQGNLPFRAIDHGLVTPDQLNHIYNQCFAGLSLSFTNVSLVPHEMLAAGCFPVVNDAPQNRQVLANDAVHYAQPTPHALARALESVVLRPDFEQVSLTAAASVQSSSWVQAGATVSRALIRAIEGGAPAVSI
ncbi:MAG: glycosyltransferase family 1 protein [Devosia sp.]